MNLNKKFRILVTLSSIFFAVLLLIMVLGALLPSESATMPWFVWAAIVHAILFIITICLTYSIIYKKEKKQKE